MSNTVEGEIDGCSFQWKIENISQCWWPIEGDFIKSPTFIADSLQSTKWNLSLSPFTDGQHVSLYLNRDCSGPNVIEVHCQLAMLNKYGSIFKKVTTSKSFERDDSWGCKEFVTSKSIFISERETILFEDTLTVVCTVWNKNEPLKLKHLYAQTIFKRNRRSVLWKIDKSSIRKLALRNKFKDELADFDLVFNKKVGFENEIIIIRNSYDECIKYFSVQTYIIGSEGKRENCGREEFFTNYLKKGVLSFKLDVPRKLIENLYLQNDILSLYCEFVFGSETVEQDSFGSRIISNELENEVSENETKQVGKKKFQNTTILSDDLKLMFNDGLFSDMELRTLTHTFLVHKCILSARSSVFRRMFSNNTKETNSGHVDITDLETDTVRRMLLYLYTDFLEELQCDSACKLFAAADKYDISSLKIKCSSFLKENLCPSEACKVLFLADQHQIYDLKTVVEDYILDHEEVFNTPEWVQFMDTNLKLAADIMYRKINHGKILP